MMMIIDHRENLQLFNLIFFCAEMLTVVVTQPVSGQWAFMMTPEIAYVAYLLSDILRRNLWQKRCPEMICPCLI